MTAILGVESGDEYQKNRLMDINELASLKIAELQISLPAPVGDDGWDNTIHKKMLQMFWKTVRNAFRTSFFLACEANQHASGVIDVCHLLFERRHRDKIAAVFDQGHKLLANLFCTFTVGDIDIDPDHA